MIILLPANPGLVFGIRLSIIDNRIPYTEPQTNIRAVNVILNFDYDYEYEYRPCGTEYECAITPTNTVYPKPNTEHLITYNL